MFDFLKFKKNFNMDITVKMARFQVKQSVLIGNTTLVFTFLEELKRLIGPIYQSLEADPIRAHFNSSKKLNTKTYNYKYMTTTNFNEHS